MMSRNIIGVPKIAVLVIDRLNSLSDIMSKHHGFITQPFALYYDRTIESIEEYNVLLTNRHFWNEILEENILVIQHDSALLRNIPDYFYEFDYVGAPWKFQEHGGNGGFSLRKKSAMIKCIENVPYNGTDNEDIYFSNALKSLNMNIAPREECEKFSCEAIFKLGTVGYHAIEKYHSNEQCNLIKRQYENI